MEENLYRVKAETDIETRN